MSHCTIGVVWFDSHSHGAFCLGTSLVDAIRLTSMEPLALLDSSAVLLLKKVAWLRFTKDRSQMTPTHRLSAALHCVQC